MNIEKRKEELKVIALEHKLNGAQIYQLISEGNLDHIVNKINDKETKSKSDKNIYLSGNEQFIDVLCSTFHYFEDNFSILPSKILWFQKTFKNKIPKFLLSKKYYGDNKFIPYYEYNTRKLFVENMYLNIKFIYDEFNEFFVKNGITKNLLLKNKNDVNILFNFMKKMVWCNYDDFSLIYLFDNYKSYIKEYKNTSKDYLNSIHLHFAMHWEKMIENFNNRIEYIKIIM